jgi:hypothetical protein
MRVVVGVAIACAACGRIGFESAALAPCGVLDASWTPQWSTLIAYEPFDGAGPIGDAATIPAVVGSAGVAGNADNSGMTYVAGKLGQAISFDGIDDYVTLPLPPIDTAIDHSVSIAVWMRWSGTLYAGNSSNWTKVLLFLNPEYALTFVSAGPPALGFNTGVSDLLGIRPTGFAGAWIHVVAVFVNGAPGMSRLYIDGQEQTMSPLMAASPSPSVVSTPLIVAAFPTYPSFFAGALDELAVWNSALSSSDVATLYTTQASCP